MKKNAARKLNLVEAPAPSIVKLDLGCGLNPGEGFEGVDLYGDKAKHRVDLFKFPWPFASDSVDEMRCSHFLEHVPAREIQLQDMIAAHPRGAQLLGQDMLFAFMDEVWRILKPDAWIDITVPSARSHRAFQDPTHRRFFVPEVFFYFNRLSREQMGLSHYRVRCNFATQDSGVATIMDLERAKLENARCDEVKMDRYNGLWNLHLDYNVKLRKIP